MCDRLLGEVGRRQPPVLLAAGARTPAPANGSRSTPTTRASGWWSSCARAIAARAPLRASCPAHGLRLLRRARELPAGDAGAGPAAALIAAPRAGPQRPTGTPPRGAETARRPVASAVASLVQPAPRRSRRRGGRARAAAWSAPRGCSRPAGRRRAHVVIEHPAAGRTARRRRTPRPPRPRSRGQPERARSGSRSRRSC